MMKRLARFSIAVVTAVLLASCSVLRRQAVTLNPEARESLITELASEPAACELTADVRYNLGGRSLNGQLRMRRGRCIQLSATLLGMEIFRVEFFPDHIMIMNRSQNLYAQCHYADLPYRNELGLDYNMIEAMFWNRIFSPGRESAADISSVMTVGQRNADGTVEIRDMEWNHKFKADSKNRLTAFSKQGNGWNFTIGYSGFIEPVKGYGFPSDQKIELGILKTGNVVLELKLNGISISGGSWKDETQPTRRMSSVSLDRMLEFLDQLGL